MFQRWFGRRIRRRPAEQAAGDQVAASQEGANAALRSDTSPGAFYNKGHFIDPNHEICDVLGIGGFGVVYLVYSHETNSVYAFKTLRDEHLDNEETRERFHREANVWVDLECHPYIVRAYYVKEIASRLYIAMEYIAPDSEGLNSLAGHLKRRPPDLAQSLRWAIQFCHAMEYAYAMGLRCHRDIKPDNILISCDHTLKITDFGIAGILGASAEGLGIGLIAQNSRVGSPSLTMQGSGFGTPTHMPPEQFNDPAACDERSDIYSFGVVLYQMRTGGKCPFPPPLPRDDSKGEVRSFWTAMRILHTDTPVPNLNSRLFPVIERCLQKEPRNRYRSFQELRSELEPMLQHLTEEVIAPPDLKNREAWEWNDKGLSLRTLKRYDEAIRCYEKATRDRSAIRLRVDQQSQCPDCTGSLRRRPRLLLEGVGDRSARCRWLDQQGHSPKQSEPARRCPSLLLESRGDRSTKCLCLDQQGDGPVYTGPARSRHRMLF